MIMKNPADTSNCPSLKRLLIFQALFIPVGLVFFLHMVYNHHTPLPLSSTCLLSDFVKDTLHAMLRYAKLSDTTYQCLFGKVSVI